MLPRRQPRGGGLRRHRSVARRRRDPADLRLRSRRLLQPGPRPRGATFRPALERLPAVPSWAPAARSAWRVESGVVPAPPVNTVPPPLAGSGRLGAPSRPGAGTWLNAPASYATAAGSGPPTPAGNIAGGVRALLPAPPTADVGATLRVDGHGHQRRRRGDRRLAADRARRRLRPGPADAEAPATPRRPPEDLPARPHAPREGHARGAHRRGPGRARGAHRLRSRWR